MATRYTQKFSPEVVDQIVDFAGKGATNKIIARAIGVHEDTFQTWIRQGRDTPEDFPDHGEMYRRMEEARASLAIDMSERVIQAANSGLPNTWQAAMTFLERRYPMEWGRNDRMTVDGDAVALPQINILVLNDPDARRAHQDLLGRLAGSGPGKSVGSGVRGELEAGRPGEPE